MSSAVLAAAFLNDPGTNGDPDRALLQHLTAKALPLWQATVLRHSLLPCSKVHAAKVLVKIHAHVVKNRDLHEKTPVHAAKKSGFSTD